MATFRARARAVDMLGRQQIAGIPTAISELFKNAHDAYADNVEVDFYRTDGLFVLRDNGVGMTLAEFEDRWLTLGTESKLNSPGGLKPPPIDPLKSKRPVLGEKGIGRLAIAAIGPQLLILTRATSTATASPLVAAFINWGLFRLPGVDLEQILVPTRVFPTGALPKARDVLSMVKEVRANLLSLKRYTDAKSIGSIGNQLDDFDVDPHELANFLGSPSLTGEGHGTHFYIQPADESLSAAIDGPGLDDEIAPPLLKTLVGFANTMTPGHSPPVIATAFRDHKTDDITDELIGEAEFFSPAEFREADHHIEGHFDDFGQFQGSVTVYGEPSLGHVVPWPANGRRTECGPFRINLAVVQGAARESTMPSEEWLRVSRKLGRYGGLYIYRDGIRVLPYGNNDYDFLDIERNRTKSASYYYFSYRRIFGVVEIDRASNPSLNEKAGREGFRENRAYRQFQEILKNFFVQIAADFFRDGGARADHFIGRRAELDRLERARREREKQVSVRRGAFKTRLDESLRAFDDGLPARQVAGVLETARRECKIAAAIREPSRAASALLSLDSSTRRHFAEILDRYKLAPPRGIGLPSAVRRDYEAYRLELERVLELVFEPAAKELEALLSATAADASVSMDRRIRFESALAELTSRTRKSSQSETQEVRSTVLSVEERATSLLKESIASMDAVVKDVLSRAATVDVSGIDDPTFVATRRELESEIELASDRQRRALGSIVQQLQGIAWPSLEDGEAITHVDIAEAVEEELLALRERSEADLELSQLGMAVQVISHEFDATIKSVRKSVRELRAWADANQDLQGVYGNIRRSFDHLDGYLALFTPLQRRLYRRPIRITGAEVAKFLQDLFHERLGRHKVRLEATAQFKRFGFVGFPSTFYPVFVNIIDNAIFWLSRHSEPRIVRLGIDDDSMVIANSGPPVAERDRELIFDLGFTRKPGGRGLGLQISRKALEKEGYQLELAKSPPNDFGVAFRIERRESGTLPAKVRANRVKSS